MSEDAESLARDLRAHYAGLGSLANTVWATYGVASRPGRILNDSRFRKLGPLLAELGVDAEPEADPQPSVAAGRMSTTAIIRGCGRRVAMPPATRAAVVAYVKEHVGLLERAQTLAPQSKLVQWHLVRAYRLRDTVGTEAAA